MGDQQLYTEEVVDWPEQLIVQKVSGSLSILGSYIIVREVLAEEFAASTTGIGCTVTKTESILLGQPLLSTACT